MNSEEKVIMEFVDRVVEAVKRGDTSLSFKVKELKPIMAHIAGIKMENLALTLENSELKELNKLCNLSLGEEIKQGG